MARPRARPDVLDGSRERPPIARAKAAKLIRLPARERAVRPITRGYSLGEGGTKPPAHGPMLGAGYAEPRVGPPTPSGGRSQVRLAPPATSS